MSERLRSLLPLGAALFLLNASLTFVNIWPTPAVTWTGHLSVELAVVVLALGLVHARRRAPSALTLRLLTCAWLALVLGRYTFVTAPALWGRELNFYWDLRFLPDVFSMLAHAAAPWLVAVVVCAAAALCALTYAAVRWALRQIDTSAANGARRRGLMSAAAVAVLLFAAQRARVPDDGPQPFAEPVTAAYARQARAIADGMRGDRVLPASPSFDTDLSRLRGADVLLFFIESYGAVTFERPEFSEPLTARRARLERIIHDTGNRVASAFVTSPTFGGSSWFAHITLMSGVKVGDPDTNARLMSEKRDTLPAAMARHGYRSIAMMPGLWTPWPEGAFYGFEDIYTGPRMDYQGPSFGWWDMPDQFTLARLDERERDMPARRPLFVFFPTISTHTPFSPRAPYQPDWHRLLTERPYDAADVERAYDEWVDWTNLGPSYVRAMDYAYDTLAGYLEKHRGEPFVMIAIGDHQPPALVSGEQAPWEVPVHVITSNADVLGRLESHGLTPGLVPTRPALGPMEALLPMLIDAFGDNRP